MVKNSIGFLFMALVFISACSTEVRDFSNVKTFESEEQILNSEISEITNSNTETASSTVSSSVVIDIISKDELILWLKNNVELFEETRKLMLKYDFDIDFYEHYNTLAIRTKKDSDRSTLLQDEKLIANIRKILKGRYVESFGKTKYTNRDGFPIFVGLVNVQAGYSSSMTYEEETDSVSPGQATLIGGGWYYWEGQNE